MFLKDIFSSVNFITFFTLKLDFKMLLFVSWKRTFCHIQVTNITPLGFMDIYHMLSQNDSIVEGFFSQVVHFDSFFLWYSLKCLWKRSELLKAFPHSGHNLSFSMFMAQRIWHNWRIFNTKLLLSEACDLVLVQTLLATFYRFAIFQDSVTTDDFEIQEKSTSLCHR